MITIRPSLSRGHAKFDWLDSRHTFSFGQYYNPAYLGFGALRVINDDRIAPGAGFPMHGHEDMEIVTYVLDGALEHHDSLGNQGIIRAGEVQRMRAGTGIHHSEHNASATEGVHLLQIWIQPDKKGLEPGYQQIQLDSQARAGRLQTIASPDGRDGSVDIHQNALIYAARLAPGDIISHPVAKAHKAYLQVASGSLMLNDCALNEGDGAAITGQDSLTLTTQQAAEVLLFELH